jgi:hypothetical protein
MFDRGDSLIGVDDRMHHTRPCRTIALTLTVLATAAFAAAADPVFVLHQPLTQTLSPRSPNVVPILLSSAQEVTQVTVTIVQIRTPHGELLPVELFTIDKPPTAVGPAGSRFSLTLNDATSFKESGDYPVTIRLTGVQNKAAQAQLLSLTINVPAPTLDVARHQGSTLRVRRWTPWSSGGLDETLRFEETSGRANVADLNVAAQEMFLKGTTERADASVTVVNDAGQKSAPLTVPANGQVQIRLQANALDTAGILTFALVLTSPSLTAPITVPLQIEVSDRWPLPLLVIFLGVILGAWIRHLSQVAQPREAARFRRSLLAGQVARFRDRSRDPQQIQELDAIDDMLRRSEDQLQLGNVPAATALLDQAEAAIAAFRKTSEERFLGVLKRLRDTASKIDELRGRIPDGETADLASLETARQHIAAAQQALTTFDVPLADTRIALAITIVDELTASHPPQAAGRGLAPRRARAIAITVAEADADRIAGQILSFAIADPAALIAAADAFEWDFGDGVHLTTTVPQAGHPFSSAGNYRTRVAVLRAGAEVAAAILTVDVVSRPIERIAQAQAQSLWRIASVLTLMSLVIAALTCMGLLFLGKSFGTPQQYLEAFLWGFGIDSGVKNVSDVLKKAA